MMRTEYLTYDELIQCVKDVDSEFGREACLEMMPFRTFAYDEAEMQSMINNALEEGLIFCVTDRPDMIPTAYYATLQEFREVIEALDNVVAQTNGRDSLEAASPGRDFSLSAADLSIVRERYLSAGVKVEIGEEKN